jgi:hypothetical protein
LVDNVEEEPGEMALGEPVTQVGREQEGLVAVAAKEGVDHSLFYAPTTFIPNGLLRKCQQFG